MGAVVLSLLARMLARTWRVERAPWPVDGPCVVAFWHGEQLPMILLHRDVGLTGVTSLSRDGELLAGVLRRLGYGVIRGSSSRGGTAALRASIDLLRAGGRPALAVDGPRGPAGVVQPGAAALARRCGVPVVYGRVEASPAWRLRSWDRFVVPRPGARVRIRYGVWHPTPPGRDGGDSLAEAMLEGAGAD